MNKLELTQSVICDDTEHKLEQPQTAQLIWYYIKALTKLIKNVNPQKCCSCVLDIGEIYTIKIEGNELIEPKITYLDQQGFPIISGDINEFKRKSDIYKSLASLFD